MRFLADMGISQATVAWLKKAGHVATHVSEAGMQKSTDAEIIAKARNEACVGCHLYY